MEDNTNQAQNERKFDKNDAYQTLDIVNTWIANIDTKISFALALSGVLIGVIFNGGLPSAFQRIIDVSKLSLLSSWEILAVMLVGALYGTSFVSIICFVWSIMARVEKSDNIGSVFFFGNIGKMESQNYKDKVNHITESELIEDLEEQIYTNSKICNQKIKWYNKGMTFLLFTIVLWFICMAFRLI